MDCPKCRHENPAASRFCAKCGAALSVVFPEAPHKFFLEADPAIRAQRRQAEMARLYGSQTPIAQIQEQLHFRDGLDRSRRVGPLITPEGATVIDTSHLTTEQVVEQMLGTIGAAPQAGRSSG